MYKLKTRLVQVGEDTDRDHNLHSRAVRRRSSWGSLGQERRWEGPGKGASTDFEMCNGYL